MAAGVTQTVESVLASIIQGHLECSICHTRYQEPKMLDCSHSFCLKCLQELKKRQSPEDTKITCPLCQRQTLLPEGRVTQLNNNYGLLSLVEEITKQEQLLKGEGSNVVICQACDEENEAVSRCVDCEHYLCRECQKAHQRFTAMKTHKITALQEQEEFASKSESEKNISNCESHPSQELCFYCHTCEQLICKRCTTSSHKEPMHIFVDVNVAFDIYLHEAHEINSQVSQCEAEGLPNCMFLRSRLSTMLANARREISSATALKVARVRQEEMKLLQQAQAAYRKKDKTLAKVIFAQQTVKRTCSEVTAADRLEVLKHRQDLLHDYKDVKCKTMKDVNSQLSFLAFKENCNANEVELGTLQLEERWELIHQLEVAGIHIAAFSTGEMAVTCNGTLSILCRDDQEGYKQSTDTKIAYATDIAINKDDHMHLLISYPNQQAVNIFNKEHQLLRQFTPGEEAGIAGTPSCLAVDDSNLIAVGYADKEQISLHNPDGSLIRTLPAPMIDQYLTVSNKHLIYSNSTNRKIMSVDYQGNNIFTICSFRNSTPHGLCCDKAGDIYAVANCQCLNTSLYQIHHYSREGTYIDTPLKHLPYNSYFNITFTANHHSALTGYNSTQIYQRV